MKLLGGMINLMNMSLSKLWESAMDREALHVAPHDIAKSGHDWEIELNWFKEDNQGAGRSL